MKKKVLAVALIITLLLISMTIVVSAASSFTLGVRSSKSEVQPGDTIIVYVSVSNINKDEKDGLNAVKGTVSYDSNVLTLTDGISAVSGWTLQAINEGTFAVSRVDGNYVTNDQEIISFTFKVKDDTTATSTEIKITDVTAAFGLNSSDLTDAQTIAAANASTIVKINSSTEFNPSSVEPTTNTTPTTQTGSTSTSSSTPTVTSNVPVTTANDKTLPQTGIEDVILPAIVILGVISVISYISYRKYKNI